jgi:hypothetical protein
MALTDHKPVTVFSITPPFKITEAPSKDPEDPEKPPPKNSYYIGSGVCFSSFSFDRGSFVPIRGLGSGTSYILDDNKKFFIDFTILKNLQVSGAQIRCETVGTEGDFWKGYPNMIEINPQDEVDENGKVTKLVDGKVQTNCYVLIGYRADDTLKNGPTPTTTVLEEPVQILDTNIILLASVVSGVPVVFPAPYFNGQAHLNAIEGLNL